MEKINLSLAPIQGITDFVFRNLYEQNSRCISKLYTPFIRYPKEREIKKSQLIDLYPQNNNTEKVIPQVLSNESQEILNFANLIHDYGYSEINWNMGCPFPMVVKRKLGSGLLPFPDLIEKILEEIVHKLPVKLSIKMRLGFESNSEIIPILGILDRFSIAEIIIHPRIGKQMYKGLSDVEFFKMCKEITKHKLCYNGDINDSVFFNKISQRLESVNNYMLGRGAISNPFLFEEIAGTSISAVEKQERFSNFHKDLFEAYSKILAGPGHIIIKMQQLWEYFSNSFNNPHKVNKLVKKANTLEKYQNAVYQILNEYRYTA